MRNFILERIRTVNFQVIERKYLLFFSLVFFVNYVQAQADFTMSASVGCTPLHVGLDVKNIVPDSTIWEFGDGTKAKGNSAFKLYESGGVFVIKMTAYKGGVPSVVTKNVTVNKTPVSNFEFDKVSGCPPLEVNFKDKSTTGGAAIIKRTWGFANGIVIEGNNTSPTQIFNSPGPRDISLIVEDQNGCKNSKTFPAAITVLPRPNVDFEFRNSNSCKLPVETVFTNKSDSLTKNSFAWDFGDGKSSSQISPTNFYTSEGTFNIKLTATDANGCKNEKTLSNMIVNENFSVDINFADSVGCDSLHTKFQPVISSLYKKLTWTIDPRLTADMATMTLSGKDVGEYEVKLEATSQFGCTISKVRKVYITKKPKAEFIASPLLSCQLPATINFTNQSQNATKYNWLFSDGFPTQDIDPTRVLTKLGNYNVRLIALNDMGCTDTMFKVSYVSVVNPVVEIQVDNASGCAPLQSRFSVQSMNGFTISNVQWNFGNGNTFTGINPPVQTFNSANSYIVTARVSFAEGCNDVVVTKTINVGNSQTINASISATDICPSTLLTGQASAISGATYEWSIGGIETIPTRTFSYKFTQSGTFNIRLAVTKDGCISNKTIGTVTVKPTAANFIIVNNCSGGQVTFRNNNSQEVESTWDFGDGVIKVDNGRTVNHEYKTYGTYAVKLTVNNKQTGCKDELIKTVEVKKKSSDGFTLNPVKGCAPLSVSFSSIPGSSSNYWYVDSMRSTGPNFNRVVSKPGVYDLILLSTVDGCRDSMFFKDLIQVVQPDAGFQFDPIGGCSPITVTFEDTSKSLLSNITKLNWKIGNLATETANKFTKTFTVNAIIPVTLTVEDNLGCKDTVIHDLVVARPNADFELPSASFCTGNAFKPVNLATGVGLRYFWDFGDGTPIETDSAPQHFYANEGVYDFELKIIDANDCEDVKRITNAITIQDIEYDFSAYPTTKHCPELLTDFTIIPSNITYRRTVWDLGNGTVIDDTTRNPKYLYMAAGVYDVTLSLEDYRGCKEVIKKEKLIDIGGPSGEFNVTMSSSCVPVEVLIVADIKNSIANFWDYGDGDGKYDTEAHSETKHTYLHSGVFKPSVTVDDGKGCIVTVFGPELKVGGAIPKIYKGSNLVCTGEQVAFADVSTFEEHAPVVSRLWTFSDGFTSTDSAFTRNIATADSMDLFVKLEVTDAVGCKDYIEDTLRVFANAPLEVEDGLVICKGDSVQLNASRVHYYEWVQSGSLSATDIPNPQAFPLQTTTYNVRGYVSPTCYTDKTVTVEVREAFSGSASQDTILCVGDSARLWVRHDVINSGKFKYQWTLNGNVVDTVPQITVAPAATSTYLVNVKNGACKDFNQSVTVDVKKYPELSVSESVTILAGQETKLEAFSDPGVSYSWNPLPNTGCSNCPFAFVRPRNTTTYTISVKNQTGCEVTEEITVDVVSGCDGDMLEIQNVFTPNNDGINDYFTLKNNTLIKLGRIRIYARTGEIVYESANIVDAWDGTFNGVHLNSGVYVYYLEAQCRNGEPLLLKGNITLLR